MTSTFLRMSPVCRGHYGNLVFCRKWLGCCDEVLTKVYWSTRFGARFREKSCSALLRPVIDTKKSLETNLINLYSWDIHSLWTVFMCYFWPVVCSSRSFLVYLVMLLYTGCVSIYVCSMGTSCGYVFAAVMIHEFRCCFRERKFTL